MTVDQETSERTARDGETIPFLEELFRGDGDPGRSGRDGQGGGGRPRERGSDGEETGG